VVPLYLERSLGVGGELFIDEQTCSMQGKSEYRTRGGKFKRIGDGIQTDCIADDEFNYDFYFHNEPVDTKWIDKGMYPMYARLLYMFGNLKEAGHRCKMDNLVIQTNTGK